MRLFMRRSVLKSVGLFPIVAGSSALDCVFHSARCEEFAADKATIEKWMDAWSKTDKQPVNPLFLSRFADHQCEAAFREKWMPEKNIYQDSYDQLLYTAPHWLGPPCGWSPCLLTENCWHLCAMYPT